MIRIPNERNYWLVRTSGGSHYNEFVSEGFIAIGWNEIFDLELIKQAATDANAYETLTKMSLEILSKDGKEDKQPGRITNPIIRFVTEMVIGDVVIIPSEDSRFIEFGIIEGDVYLENKKPFEFEEGLCNYLKRRKVKWVAWRDKYTLDPYLYRMLNSHYALSKVNEYAEYVDRTLFGFYIKGDNAHLVFEVQKKTGVTGVELIDFINSTLGLVDLCNELLGTNYNKKDVQLKINVQSPGPVEFLGAAPVVALIGLIIIGLTSGTYKLPFIKIEAGGVPKLIESLRGLFDDRHRHKLEEKKLEFEHNLEMMKIKLPKELSDPNVENEANPVVDVERN